MKKYVAFIAFVVLAFTTGVLADEASDQAYLNRLAYNHNKLELLIKKRLVKENRNYSQTDINTTTFSWESYSSTFGNISTSSLSRSEDVEIEDWYIYKGKVRELTDVDFLELVGDDPMLESVQYQDNLRADWRMFGNLAIGAGIIASVGGAALSANQSVITGGALSMVVGFFLNALNMSPHHYIQPDYAQQKIDEYNINLKKKLNLPIDFE